MTEYDEVKKDDVESFAKEFDLSICYTSAKDNTGIQVIIRFN